MVMRPTYSDDAVKHYGLVAWAENSKGTKYQRSSSDFDANSNLVATLFQVQNKTLSFRLGWRSSKNASISAYCRVTISPSIDKDGNRIPQRRIHRLMNKKAATTQICRTTSTTDIFTRRYHPIFRQSPGSNDTSKLISACLEIRFLRKDVTEDDLKELRTAIQAANDEGAELKDEMIDARCEIGHPDVTFQFDWYPIAARNCKSQTQNTDRTEGISESRKRKRSPSIPDRAPSGSSQIEMDDEDDEDFGASGDAFSDTEPNPERCIAYDVPNNQPTTQELTNNVASTSSEVGDQLQILQELNAEEKALEDELRNLIQIKRQRVEVMRKAIGELKQTLSSTS